MRILFWAEHFWPLIGGAENRLLFTIEELTRRGHACCVITNQFPTAPLEYEERQGVPVHRFPIRDALFKRDVRRLADIQRRAMVIKREFRPDVENVMCTGPSLMVQQMCQRALPCPTVASLHSDFQSIFRNEGPGVLGNMLRRASAVMVISDPMREEVLAKFPDLAPRLAMVRSGLPLPELEPTPLPYDPPVLLCLGRLVNRKGFDLAVQALHLLQAEFPALRMMIAGDGPEKPVLEQLVQRLGLATKVTFTGWVQPEEVPGFLNQATFSLVPSRNEEASSVVLRESVQMARPVLASRVGGTPEIIQDGVNGLLYPKEDPAAIAAAVRRLLLDPTEAHRLGQAGRARADEQFGFAKFFDAFLTLHLRVQQQAPTSESPAVES